MIEILHKNFGFKKVNDPFGNEAIQMSARDAFRYSLVQGSPYLKDEYGITLKEQLKVFYHRSSLNQDYYMYCPGLFGVKRSRGYNPRTKRKDEDIVLDEGNAPFYFKKKCPEMFHTTNKKTVIFHTFDVKGTKSRAEIERTTYNNIKDAGKKPADYLLTIVRSDESQKENFLEYVACEYFNRQGYLTENQVPFINNKGIPDFAAYKLPDKYMNALRKYKFVEVGCCIPEIAAACTLPIEDAADTTGNNSYDMIIGEAKVTSYSQAKPQLEKYASQKLASHLFALIPSQLGKVSKYGMFQFDEDKMINYKKGPKQTNKRGLVNKDQEFLLNYIKFYVLANLPLEKIKGLVWKKIQKRSPSLNN